MFLIEKSASLRGEREKERYGMKRPDRENIGEARNKGVTQRVRSGENRNIWINLDNVFVLVFSPWGCIERKKKRTQVTFCRVLDDIKACGIYEERGGKYIWNILRRVGGVLLFENASSSTPTDS